MKIGKIDGTNFGGLWSIEHVYKRHNKDNTTIPVMSRSIVYHPFKDETEEETKEALVRAASRKAFACYPNFKYNFKNVPNYYLIQKPKLGERLKITKDEYAQVADMQQTDKPLSNQFLTYEETEKDPQNL